MMIMPCWQFRGSLYGNFVQRNNGRTALIQNEADIPICIFKEKNYRAIGVAYGIPFITTIREFDHNCRSRKSSLINLFK